MWMTDPAIMCRQHLLGEHVETHMSKGTIEKGISITGYLENDLLEPSSLVTRHAELAAEMQRRKYKHKSPLTCVKISQGKDHLIDREKSHEELLRRCPDCRARYAYYQQTGSYPEG